MNIRKLVVFTTLSMLIILSMNVTLASGFGTPDRSVSPDASTLTIVTRHDSAIYTAFESAFLASTLAQDAGITNIDFKAATTYDGFFKLMTDPSLKVDMGWGGGPTLFNALIRDGAVSPITDTAVLAAIDGAVGETLAGATMKQYENGELLWAANAISSFGFTVNHKELQERGLPVPKTWADLASPDFFTSASQPNIGLGNAPDTTSNTRIYQIIFQKYGWERGWAIINGMAGNGQIYGGSVDTRSSVISGETAVAMTIDFYGVIAQGENPNTEYIVPDNASIVNGDPIALSKSPTNIAGANAFLKFLFSQEGQAIWLKDGINRLPVRADAFDTPEGQARPDIKTIYDKTITNKGIEFNESLALSLEEAMRFYWQASITDVHDKLKSTWAKLMNDFKGGAFSENRLDELMLEFGKPAITIEEAQEINLKITGDADFRLQKMTEWSQFATEKFANVDNLRTEPETIYYTITTVISGITTVITTTELINASSVSDTVTDIPFSTLGFVVAIFSTSVLVMSKRKKEI